MWKRFEKRTAIYRTKSQINNLRLAVKLKTINSLIKVPIFDRTLGESDPEADVAGRSAGRHVTSMTDEDPVEVVTIGWQEKILSRYEIEYYRDLENCATDVQKEYHRRILTEDDGETSMSAKHRIFTYVADDNFALNEILVDDRYESRQTSRQFRRNPAGSTTAEVMYIFADLNPDSLLCCLKWYASDGVLIVYPDFNEFQVNPYHLEIDTDFRHLYTYAVENISNCGELKFCDAIPGEGDTDMNGDGADVGESVSGNASAPTIRNYGELIDLVPRTAKFEEDLGAVFEMPPKRCTRVLLLVELLDGVGFEYDNIHVRYRIMLPEHVTLESIDGEELHEEQQQRGPPAEDEFDPVSGGGSDFAHNFLAGSTHTSSRRDEKWNFGHCLQLCLIYDDSCDLVSPLRIFFDVISIDLWDRERTEGFASVQIDLNNSSSSMEIRSLTCFRINHGFWERVERFFIGGRRKFDFHDFDVGCDGFLNRYQTDTISTGTLNLKWSKVMQNNPDLYGECITKAGRTKGMTLGDIIKAYQLARRRLEATTKSN